MVIYSRERKDTLKEIRSHLDQFRTAHQWEKQHIPLRRINPHIRIIDNFTNPTNHPILNQEENQGAFGREETDESERFLQCIKRL